MKAVDAIPSIMYSAAMNININDQFGHLTVISEVYRRKNPSGRSIPFCLVRCLCGTVKEMSAWKLTAKAEPSRSCGCLQAKASRDCKLTHGGCGSRLYAIFKGMKARCFNPNVENYPNYGGRGITVCDEWLNDFTAFRDWALNNGYADDLVIDRINPNGHYEPSNCQWLTVSENTAKRNRELRLTRL